ncbi:alpha/beta-hydrolase [Trametes sanguinea]|nr:alpha/beta-hydrolase [Trametes sanguinea]
MAFQLLRYQPFKGLYLTYFFSTLLLVRVPLWLIWFLPARNRPRASWSITHCICIMGIRKLMSLPRELGVRKKHSVPPPAEGPLKNAKLVWIEGLSENSDVFCGEVRKAAAITGVKPVDIAAYWFYKPGSALLGDVKAKPGERTFLHLHGGAFHLGSARPDSTTANITRGLLAHSGKLERGLAVEYRLSATTPHPSLNPYPSALLDSIAAYRYLVVDAGFEPQNIAIVGDSAGGNLAFALVRHFVENAISGIAPPGALLSLSSWLDLSFSRVAPEDSFIRNSATDIFPLGSTPEAQRDSYSVRAYMGPLDREQAKTNPYISPASAHITSTEGLFKGFPRTFISAGGAEKILDDSTAAAERLRADGIDVTVDIVPDAVHDFMTFTWHEPERTEGLKRACKWLDS